VVGLGSILGSTCYTRQSLWGTVCRVSYLEKSQTGHIKVPLHKDFIAFEEWKLGQLLDLTFGVKIWQ
jgi:hypothetical protein